MGVSVFHSWWWRYLKRAITRVGSAIEKIDPGNAAREIHSNITALVFLSFYRRIEFDLQSSVYTHGLKHWASHLCDNKPGKRRSPDASVSPFTS